MSLDFSLYAVRRAEVFEANITHNLNEMAEAAGVYEALWHPERIPATHAADIIELLSAGLEKLKGDPKKYEAMDSPNGWGTYKHFVPFVERVLEACMENPDAEIEVSV